MAPTRYTDHPPEEDDMRTRIPAGFSDSEDDLEDDEDDIASVVPRTSTELAAHDREVLDEEEENQRLLRGERGEKGASASNSSNEKTFFQRLGHGVAGGREGGGGGGAAGSRRSRNRKPIGARYRDSDEKGEMMYEMEEGGPRGDTPVSSSESEGEGREKVGIVAARRGRTSCCARLFRYTIINIAIAITFIAIAFGAYKATRHDHSLAASRIHASNGTHAFQKTTILLSLDGFRADFLQRGLTPTLNSLIREGVSPPYMTPSFPSVTFPNHYTLVTGLYPESHGVVGNTFYDPDLDEEFYYTDPSAMQPKWWLGEPLWVTAERQGVRVAAHMWPGSEAHVSATYEPSFVDRYNGTEQLDVKVDRILALLDKPGPDPAKLDTPIPDQRPQLIVAYVPDVDAAGHRFGPNSTDMRATISAVDGMVARLLTGLSSRNLSSIVNVVVVSDHGMATTSINRLIQFEDLVDPTLIARVDGWPHYGLRPRDPAIADMLFDHLLKESREREGFDVYTKETMPERYHFSSSPRIAPLWIVPRVGWAIVTRDEMDVDDALRQGATYKPRGLHGYDHEHPLMRAIFVARGPAFPHQGGSRVDVFQNTEVYNVLCDSIGVEPRPNNGTLRLPFITTGIHDELRVGEEYGDGVEDFTDDVPEGEYQNEVDHEIGEQVGNGKDGEDEAESSGHKDVTAGWLDWFKQKIEDTKEWIKDQFSGKYSGKIPLYDPKVKPEEKADEAVEAPAGEMHIEIDAGEGTVVEAPAELGEAGQGEVAPEDVGGYV